MAQPAPVAPLPPDLAAAYKNVLHRLVHECGITILCVNPGQPLSTNEDDWQLGWVHHRDLDGIAGTFERVVREVSATTCPAEMRTTGPLYLLTASGITTPRAPPGTRGLVLYCRTYAHLNAPHEHSLYANIVTVD